MKIICALSLLLITVDGALLDGLGGHHHDHHHDHHDHHHDHHDHHHDHEDFPLATGKEAAHASARLLEFFNALLDEQVQLPNDMPLYNEIPTDVQFSCNDKLPGYYADVNYGCQVYHMCLEDPEHGVASFLCPNATIFHQAIFACDWWFNVDCPAAPDSYHLNENIYKDPEVEENNSENNFLQQSQFDVRLERSPSLQTVISLPQQQFVIPVPGTINSQKALNSLGSDYLPPKPDYLPPKPDYLPPKPDYLPPKPDYLPPKPDYLPPKPDYLPPKPDYLPPKPDYLPPKPDYLPPKPDYLPPQ